MAGLEFSQAAPTLIKRQKFAGRRRAPLNTQDFKTAGAVQPFLQEINLGTPFEMEKFFFGDGFLGMAELHAASGLHLNKN